MRKLAFVSAALCVFALNPTVKAKTLKDLFKDPAQTFHAWATTCKSMSCIDVVYRSLEQLKELDYYEENVVGFLRGDDHPRTIAERKELDEWRAKILRDLRPSIGK